MSSMWWPYSHSKRLNRVQLPSGSDSPAKNNNNNNNENEYEGKKTVIKETKTTIMKTATARKGIITKTTTMKATITNVKTKHQQQ